MRVWALALVAAIGGLDPAWALDPDLGLTQYARAEWRAPRQLPHDNVAVVIQDRQGYLWVGTVEGLARFDGVRSVVFNKANTPQIRDNWITDLIEDDQGRLWIGTFGGGIARLENGEFHHHGADQGLPSDVIHALHTGPDGRIWAGTAGGGVVVLEGDRFVRPEALADLSTITVKDLHHDPTGRLWIASQTGLYRWDLNGELTRFGTAEGLSDDRTMALAWGSEGLWVATEKGLDRIIDGSISSLGVEDGLAFERLWSLFVDDHDCLWIGTDGGGLQRYRNGQFDTLWTGNGLSNDYVWSVSQDHEGSLWIGTNGGGLTRLKTGRLSAVGTPEGLPSDFIWAVTRGHDGFLYVGSEEGGLVRLDDDAVTPFPLDDAAKVLAPSRDGSLWIGGNRGLHRLRGDRIESDLAPAILGAGINTLQEDHEGRLWIGTRTRGLYAFDQGRLQPAPGLDQLSQSNITALHVDESSVWVGTLGAVYRLAGGQVVQHWSATQGMPNSYVMTLFSAGADTWGATRAGLVRLDEDQVRRVTLAEGLPDDGIMAARLADNGDLWMGGNRGLFRAPMAVLDSLAEKRGGGIPSRLYGLEDGLRSTEINGAGSSSFKDGDGRLWFATRNGLAVVDPDRAPLTLPPPPVLIEDVQIDGVLAGQETPIEIPAGTRRVDFRFTALSYLSSQGARTRYRLQGFDRDWIEATAERATHYTNLPRGFYRFEVIAGDADGQWSRRGAAVDLVVQPHWHERWSVRVLLGLLIVSVLLAAMRFRVRLLRRQKARLEQLVRERTAEVESANARLERMVREDSLTGLANRRCFDEALDLEWRRAARQGGSVALLLADVDFFKNYNDNLGHQAGDACLKRVAASMADCHQRAGEIVARYGGEEFAILMPGTGPDEAAAAADHLRDLVRALALPHPSSSVAPVLTLSIGVASMRPTDDESASVLVERADRALYRAKKQGRDRTETQSERVTGA